jgi:hypothetical protein
LNVLQHSKQHIFDTHFNYITLLLVLAQYRLWSARVQIVSLNRCTTLEKAHIRHTLTSLLFHDIILVLAQYRLWSARVQTGRLNRWLRALTAATPPPKHMGKEIKLRFMTQVKARPPTFAVFSARAKQLSEAYVSFLRNHIRREFGLYGIPVRLQLRTPVNPFAFGATIGRDGEQAKNKVSSGYSCDVHLCSLLC